MHTISVTAKQILEKTKMEVRKDAENQHKERMRCTQRRENVCLSDDEQLFFLWRVRNEGETGMLRATWTVKQK